MKFRTIRPTVWKGIRWVTGDRAGNGTRLQRQKPDNGLAAEAEAIVGVGEPTHAHAILDRLVHNAYRIELRGESMRKINARRGRRLKAKVLMYEGYVRRTTMSSDKTGGPVGAPTDSELRAAAQALFLDLDRGDVDFFATAMGKFVDDYNAIAAMDAPALPTKYPRARLQALLNDPRLLRLRPATPHRPSYSLHLSV